MLICLLLYVMLFLGCFWIIVFIDNYDLLWNNPVPAKKYFISFIIPAYNEEEYIGKTINSLLELNYPKDKYEIIVVNDGSTDSTGKVCEKLQQKGLIKLVNKKNGGKASAINHGIKYCSGEIIGILDADSYVHKDFAENAVGYFNNPEVAAVTSSMKAVGSKNLVQKIQWVEYLFSIYLRKLMSLFNSLYVIPGPGSFYRKKVLKEIKGFSTDTLTEDMEIAFRIQKKGYVIENSLNSIVMTETPQKLYGLIKQRRRWYTGYIEDSIKHKELYARRDSFLSNFILPLNIVSNFTLIFITFYFIFNFCKDFLNNYIRMGAINFDILNMLKFPNLTLELYKFSFMNILSIIFTFLSVIVIFFSLRVSKEKISLKDNWVHYLSYFFIYSFLMTIFWIDSIIFKLFFRKKNRGWKYG